MENSPVIMVMGTECPPEIEKTLNEWYNNKHVPDILKFKGVKKAARYKIKHIQPTPPAAKAAPSADYPQYLAIYEFENADAVEAYFNWPGRAAIAADAETWREKGFKIKWRIFYDEMKRWQK